MSSPKPLFIGIDPGKTGGAAALTMDLKKPPIIFKFTDDYFEVNKWLRLLLRQYGNNVFVCLEKVAGQTGGIQGRVSARSMFTFGHHAGFIEGLIVGRRLPYAQVTPTVWQAEFGLLRKKSVKGAKESDGDKKRRHNKAAKKLYPKTHIIQQVSDAVLLAVYCRRKTKELF